jgi:hypothetical protein
MYFEPHLVELIQLIGYEEWPVEEARARLAPLVEKYGKDKVNAAIKEVLTLDSTQTPPRARLAPAARKGAWQMLGPPPEAVGEEQGR